MAEEGPEDVRAEEAPEDGRVRAKCPDAPEVIDDYTRRHGGRIGALLTEGWLQVEEFLDEAEPGLAAQMVAWHWIPYRLCCGFFLEHLDEGFLPDLGIRNKGTIKRILRKKARVRENESYLAFARKHGDEIMRLFDGLGSYAVGSTSSGSKQTYAEKWGISEHDRGLFSREGISLTASSCDGFIFMWQADHPDPLPPCVRCVQPHFAACSDVRTDFARMRAVSVGQDCKVVLTDLEAGARLAACRTGLAADAANSFPCVDADFSSSRCAVGTAGQEGGVVKIFDLEAERQLAALKGAGGDICSVRVDFGSRQVVAGSRDRNLYMYDIRSGWRTKTLRGHEMPVNDMAVDFEQRIALSVGDDARMILWDLDVGGVIGAYPIDASASTLAVDFRMLRAATAGVDGLVRFWDLESGDCVKVIDSEAIHVQGLDVYWEMGLVLIGSWDHQVKLFDYHSGRCMRRFHKPRRSITQVNLKRTGGHVPMDRDGAPMWYFAIPNPYDAA